MTALWWQKYGTVGQIAQAVVAVRDDQPGGKRLVAYLTLEPGSLEPGSAPGARAVRDLAAQVLPGYLVPAAIVVLGELPRPTRQVSSASTLLKFCSVDSLSQRGGGSYVEAMATGKACTAGGGSYG